MKAKSGKVQIQVGPYLSRPEVRELKRRADADLRTVGGYVARLIVEDQKRARKPRRIEAPAGKRALHRVTLVLAPGELRKLDARARAEGRSRSGYLATLIVRVLRPPLLS